MVVPHSPLAGSPSLLGNDVKGWPWHRSGYRESQNEENWRFWWRFASMVGRRSRYAGQEDHLDFYTIVWLVVLSRRPLKFLLYISAYQSC